jgi:mannose-6-phosphate isomerase-like protein (cupin superfamily)
MKGYIENIEEITIENSNFRKVLYTSGHCQLVVMSIVPGGEIGMETHADNDQFFRFESGIGKVIIDGVETSVSDGFGVIIPAGARHNIVNLSADLPLKAYTIYSPAHHRDGVIHATKETAEKDNEEFDGKTTE